MSDELEIEINEYFADLLYDEHRFLVLYGGAGSGKSVFCAQKIIYRCVTEENHKFFCFRKVGSTVRNSIWQELKDVLYDTESQNEWKINDHAMTMRHANGNSIHCSGLDDVDKMKSVKGVTGMWLDEADQFDEVDIDQLNLRIRGEKNNYVQYLISFNPIDEKHWLKRKFVDHPMKNSKVVHSTYHNNAFLTEEDYDILEGYKETNPLYYQVYCLGEWGIHDRSSKFLYTFNAEFNIDKSVNYDPDLPLKLSFDFNINPFACIVYQADESHLYVLEEIRLDNSDIYQMCDRIRAKYPPDQYHYQCTGDRTGYNNTGVVRGKTSYWAIIKEELDLYDFQLRLRTKNLDLVESRVLCNAALYSKDIAIHPSCTTLIRDCKFSNVDDKGVLIKDRQKNMNDFLDCFRYALDAEYPTLSRSPKKLNKISR